MAIFSFKSKYLLIDIMLTRFIYKKFIIVKHVSILYTDRRSRPRRLQIQPHHRVPYTTKLSKLNFLPRLQMRRASRRRRRVADNATLALPRLIKSREIATRARGGMSLTFAKPVHARALFCGGFMLMRSDVASN